MVGIYFSICVEHVIIFFGPLIIIVLFGVSVFLST
jgi:hypothetical protein